MVKQLSKLVKVRYVQDVTHISRLGALHGLPRSLKLLHSFQQDSCVWAAAHPLFLTLHGLTDGLKLRVRALAAAQSGKRAFKGSGIDWLVRMTCAFGHDMACMQTVSWHSSRFTPLMGPSAQKYSS